MSSHKLDEVKKIIKRKCINPDAAPNPVKAREHNSLIQEIYSNPKRLYECSNGQVVNVLLFPKMIEKAISGLPEEEQEDVWAVHKELKRKMCLVASAKRQALDQYSGKDYDPTSILEPMKTTILELMGQLHSDEEVQERMAMEGIPVQVRHVRAFRRKYKGQVEELQKQYEDEWHTIGITRKRARLDQFAHMYGRLKKSFDSAKNRDQTVFSREMREVLKQVKDEVEGTHVHLTVDGRIDIQTTLQMSQSVNDLYSSINYLSLIIARAAVRTGVNPLRIQYYLMNSWYNRFSGVIRNDSMFEEAPVYPSSIVMNWDTIRDKNRELNSKLSAVSEDATIMEAPVNGQKKMTLKELMGKRSNELSKGKRIVRGTDLKED